MRRTAQSIAENSERQATGDIQAIFADLKSHVGLVALIYRHLATFLGVLEWAWRILRPAFDSGEMGARAAWVRDAVGLVPQPQWRRVSGGDAILSSLYRHLANWPGYLSAAADVLQPMFSSAEIEAMAARVRDDAHAEAEALFVGLLDHEPPTFGNGTRTMVMNSLTTFARRIPEMTVDGVLLRAALPSSNGSKQG